MKKVGKLFLCIIPFLCALCIQIVISFLVMIILVFNRSFKLITGGEVDPNAITNGITDILNADVLLAISIFTATICILVFGIWYKRSNRNEESNSRRGIFTVKSILYMLLLAAGLQVGISIILNIIAMIKPEWFDTYGDIMKQLGMGNSILSIIYIALIAPISEELIFRGVILVKIKKILPFTAANILQALLFGIYHMNLVQGLYAFVIGMFLGMICLKFNSLYASILLHMLINISGIFLNLLLTEETFNTVIALVIMAVLSFGGIAFSTVKLFQNKIADNKDEI